MKITRIRIFKAGLPYVDGPHIWGANNPIKTAMASVVVVDTDAGSRGRRVGNAIHVARAVKDLDFIMEQPCKTYEECQQVRRIAEQPMKLDECVTGPDMARRVVNDRGAKIRCLKTSNLGGLSKARRVRDFLIDNVIPVVSEDTWGGQITTAAAAHFAASTPKEYLTNSTDLMNYNTRNGGPTTAGGKLLSTDTDGLGVTPDFDSVGVPVATYEA